MKVIVEPEIYLVASSSLDRRKLAQFIDDIGCSYEIGRDVSDRDAIPEVAGRVCYSSYALPRPGGNEVFLRHIVEVGHGSVLEHASFSFLIAGVSRTLTHELVRHRAGWSYSQQSQRYVDESDCNFVCPPAILSLGERHQAYLAWLEFVEDAADRYLELVGVLGPLAEGETVTERRKWARQAARSVLPGCTETRIFVTANARAWRHFLELRGSRHAEPEIRRLALAVLPILQDASPHLFGDYSIDVNGHIATRFRKV